MPNCLECRPVRAAAVMTNAKCGHLATRAGMELCAKCSHEKNACETCGQPLDPDPPPHTD